LQVATLLYKCLLAALGPLARQEARSGALDLRLERGPSRGSHRWRTDPALFPISRPVEKLEGALQAAGRAAYADDLPK
jgi:hypothetical protein